LREASGLEQVYDSPMGAVPDPARPLAAPADVARRVEEMYTAHVRLVRSVCRSLLRDRNEAEDAVQQTFLSAQRALANGSSPREPAAWLAVIARNECLARVRERMREPLPIEAEPTDFGADAHTVAVSRYDVATLREALADLPRAQREAILLRELRGLSYDEVARSLSLTTGAVESLIFRARRTLQVKLREALPALSPVALLGRLLGGGGGDLAGPAVAKVAAIGVGAALLAGGAALGPRALGLGHAAPKVQRTAPPVHLQASQRLIPSAPAHTFSAPSAPPARAATHQAKRETTDAENASSSDIAEVSSPESSTPESESGDGKSSGGTSTPGAHPSHGGSKASGGSSGSNASGGSGDSSSSDDGTSDGSGSGD
jgi:RNA polymerase sigma-70 factor, ECF subfamily